MPSPRRVLAPGALALAALAAATGCTATNAQQTEDVYAPGAAAAAALGPVHVAGLFVAADAQGAAEVVARIVNTTSSPASVSIEATSGTPISGTFEVPASDTLEVGPSGDDEVRVADLAERPGTVIEMRVAVRGGEEERVAVPVLDGTLSQYRQYVPTPTPTQTPTAAPTPTGTPSPSGSGSSSAPGSSRSRGAAASPTETTATATSTPQRSGDASPTGLAPYSPSGSPTG